MAAHRLASVSLTIFTALSLFGFSIIELTRSLFIFISSTRVVEDDTVVGEEAEEDEEVEENGEEEDKEEYIEENGEEEDEEESVSRSKLEFKTSLGKYKSDNCPLS